jgi:hypothetical protein
MSIKEFITAEELRSVRHYDPLTGLFTALQGGSRRKKGAVCGSLHQFGYIHIYVKGRSYKAHRLAWFYVYGEWPKNQIDHINGIKHDNRIDNLRDVPQSINQQNHKVARKDSGTGHIGVHYSKRDKVWCAYIRKNKKRIHLGCFRNIDQAIFARKQAELIYHPQKPLG